MYRKERHKIGVVPIELRIAMKNNRSSWGRADRIPRPFSLTIRFGNEDHTIIETEIAYLIKTEGIIILGTTGNYRYPISVLSLDSIMTKLSASQFYRVSKSMILNRNYVKYCSVDEGYIMIETNPDYNSEIHLDDEEIYLFNRWYTQ